ncbi:MAG: hypothetical protein EAZ92_00205 [Candidatus Kapaibacterium sp.]|nr:MAG: hypothetical protein EAZ92_00205 [Candidatus Kapabacteria bacterium]
MVINGDEGEGLLRQVPDATRVTYNIYTDLPDNNFVPLNYLVTECREGCKTINVIPVPLPNELPENQKYEVIDDYFDAYHYIFVRNFQSKNVGDLFSDKIRWDEVGINNKILYSNAKLNDFLQRYVPLTATTLPYEINFGSRRFRRYYDYDQSKINLAFFIDFSVCDGYIGEHWYGQTSPFGLETPAKRSIYFVNGVEIEIEGAVRYNRPSVQYQLWRNYNRYWASIVGFLGVAEETMIYAIRRRFPYKIKIPKHHLPNGYEFKIFPKLANFFFDPNGNENNFAAYPTIFDVTGMAFDKDTRKTTYGQPLIPGAAYTQSNFTFPACYKIAQQPINLPTNTNGSIRVYNYPNPTSPATTVDDVIEVSIGANPPEYSFFSFSQNDLDEQGNPTKAYYKKTTSAPINQTVGVIQHPQNNGKNEFGAYRP